MELLRSLLEECMYNHAKKWFYYKCSGWLLIGSLVNNNDNILLANISGISKYGSWEESGRCLPLIRRNQEIKYKRQRCGPKNSAETWMLHTQGFFIFVVVVVTAMKRPNEHTRQKWPFFVFLLVLQ